MDALDVVRRLHQHRAHVNRLLMDGAKRLNHGELTQPLAIGQGSVWKSLLHLYAAEYVWLETLLGNPSALLPGDLPGQNPGNQKGENPITSLGELEERWLALEERWGTYLGEVRPESLGELVYRVPSSNPNGPRLATTRSDVLLHVCTHAHYTTAQVINMLRQLGITDLPDPMLITLARKETAARS